MVFANKKSIALALAISSLTACVSTSPEVTSKSSNKDINQVQNENAHGPKARIAVAQFTDRSNNDYWWTKEIGDGMADQLTTALVGTDRFIVLERQALDSVLSEQDLAYDGRVSADTAAAYGQIEGAEIVVIAAVTEFKDGANGAKVGAGSNDIVGSLFSSVSAGFSGTHIAIDMRLVDTRTSRVLAATSVEGGSDDFNFTSVASSFGGSYTGGSLSAWSDTPKEKALRDVIQKATEFMLTKIPDDYYRYDSSNTLAAGKSAPAPLPAPVKVAKKSAPVYSQEKTDRPMTQYEQTELASAQAQLYCLGYLDEDDDDSGRYSTETVSALNRYQANNDLAVTGRLNEPTFDSLNETGCMAKSMAAGFQALATAFGGGMQSTHENNKKELEESEQNN